MKISIASITDAGIVRPNNEDAVLVCPDLDGQQWNQQTSTPFQPLASSGAMLIVADGMGGANAGEVASGLATQAFRDTFTASFASQAVGHDERADELLRQAFAAAAQAIEQRMSEDPLTDGMGTTLVVCWLVNQRAHILWCGDSRCYIYNPDSGLRRLTKDHSLVQEMIDNGELTEEEARQHPDNNIITRALGDYGQMPQPDTTSCELHPGDTLLLCSDGLCGYCDDRQIEATLSQTVGTRHHPHSTLLQQALDTGGEDNIAIVVASLVDDDYQPQAPNVLQSVLRKLFGH